VGGPIGEDAPHRLIDQGEEDHGLDTFALGALVDFTEDLPGLVFRIDKGAANVPEWTGELGQDGIAEGFSGDAGAIGDVEDGARTHGMGL